MGLFKKENCPICGVKTGILSKSSVNYNNLFICKNCAKRISDYGVFLLHIKKVPLEELQRIVRLDPLEIEKDKYIKKLKELNDETHIKMETTIEEKTIEVFETLKKEKKLDNINLIREKEKELLEKFNRLDDNDKQKNFALTDIEEFYYKYKTFDKEYIEKSIYFCKKHIDNIPQILENDYKWREYLILSTSSYRSKEETDYELSNIRPFEGEIIAFKRLAIIYEKSKQYKNGIDICEKAISHYEYVKRSDLVFKFEQRRERMINKEKK